MTAEGRKEGLYDLSNVAAFSQYEQTPQKWILSWLKHRQLATLVQAQGIAYMPILAFKSMRYGSSPDNIKKPNIAPYDLRHDNRVNTGPRGTH